MQLLKHHVNSYKSVEITDSIATTGPISQSKSHEFEGSLVQSMAVFKSKGYKGVWLKISEACAALVPVALRCGFKFHHCSSDGLLVLTAWLQPDIQNKLPPGPSHFIGVGGFVMNSKNQVLVIQERSGPSSRIPDFWKLPGGLVDPQEDIRTAVVREIKEETDLDVEFECISSIQETHHTGAFGGMSRAGTTDLYTICICKPVNEDQRLVPQPEEIKNVQWMPVEKLIASKHYSDPNHVFHKAYQTASAAAQAKLPGLQAGPFKSFLGTEETVYFAGPPKSRL